MIELCWQDQRVSARFQVVGLPGDLHIEFDPFGGRKFIARPREALTLIPDPRDRQEVLRAIREHSQKEIA